VTTNKKKRQKKIRIQRVNPDKINPIHVNDMMTSHTENEFFLTFSELEPPAVVEASDLATIEKIEAVAKIKIVITPNFARAIVRTLSENIDTFDEMNRGNTGE
jgi:hypothetical protein